MKLISVVPRGYCQGVVRAIMTAEKTVKEHPDTPIYMLGMIVHNRFVVEECKRLGIRCLEDPGKTRLELLDEIPENGGIVLFTAHGVSDAVYQKAQERHLEIVDATCPDVMKTHDLVREHVKHGDVLYIGKKNHPEAEGVIGISDRVHLISNEQDLEALGPLSDVLITNQTTLSLLDTEALMQKCRKKYPEAVTAPEICNATTIRQKAVMNLKDTDVLIVVGDPHSNNSNQLREIGLKSGIPHAYLIEQASDLRKEMFEDAETAAVTSGSSTPASLTDQVIEAIRNYCETGVLEVKSSGALRL